MKRMKNVKVGDVVQFPEYQFAPFRKGWNGWIFRVAIVNKLYISKSGVECANITYCTKCAGRYQLLPNTERTVNVRRDCLFDFNLEHEAMCYREFKEHEDNGEQVCWSQDTALLVNHGLI